MWFIILAMFIAVGFLVRRWRMSIWPALARYLIVLFCVWAGFGLSSDVVTSNIIRYLGISIVFGTGALLVADILWDILFLIRKKFFRGRDDNGYLLPSFVGEIFRAMELLANRRIGALVVIQKKIDLEPYLSASIPFDAQVKSEILVALFATSSPVHDGAIVVTNGRIKRVKAILPLATNHPLPMGFGTRHRSAIGITEKTDAVVLFVSEERGEMKIAYHGQLIRADSRNEFLKYLLAALKGKRIHSQLQDLSRDPIKRAV